jgi:glycosyltransferase involved in cell wall biosynthesis
MRILFIHPTFPAQFGMLAHYMSTQHRWPVVFLTSVDTTDHQMNFTHINYRVVDDQPPPKIYTPPASLQEMLDHMAAIYRGMRGIPDYQPDVVVGHMSFGTMLYLRQLYDCPFVGFMELYPPAFWGGKMNLRPEFPAPEGVCLFNATYHALTQLHLQACDSAYTHSAYQASTVPAAYRNKLTVLPEGIDCQVFQPKALARPISFHGRTIDESTKVVTFAAESLESVRGFDRFMQLAKKLCEVRSDVLFVVVGAEATFFGHEMYHINSPSFKQWVLAQDNYDLSRFIFLETLTVADLQQIYHLSDLHVALTAPYTLSNFFFQAMASGCAILGSNTAPVQEIITHEAQGLLADMNNIDELLVQAQRLLNDVEEAKKYREGARARITSRYEIVRCLEDQVRYFQSFGERRNQAIDEVLASLAPR